MYFTGRPEPTVTWFNGTQALDGTIEKARHVIVNRLEIPRLSRNDHNTTFRCEASNTMLMPVVEMSTTLEMLRKFS